MKKLLIIVPKGSAVDSWLADDAGFIYDYIKRLPHGVSYKMNISLSLQLIEFLVSKFGIRDFSVSCYDGEVTFRVRS